MEEMPPSWLLFTYDPKKGVETLLLFIIFNGSIVFTPPPQKKKKTKKKTFNYVWSVKTLFANILQKKT